MRKIKIFIVLLFIGIFSNISIFAQRKISGTVINRETGKGVFDIEICIKGTEISTKSDNDGKYLLRVPDSLKVIEFKEIPGMTIKELEYVDKNTINIILSSAEVDIIEFTLYELMNLEYYTVASSAKSNIRESPGIISVFTESEIEQSGARDLIDLLRLIPGFQFEAEWDGIIGLGVRGNNATEGKALILVDGHQLNETNYGIFPFGRHILIDNIKQIEIIRGPGSAQYGGAAELAVIKISTKKGSDINGIDISSGYSMSNSITSNTYVQLSGGEKFKNGFDISLSGYYNKSNRSNLDLKMLDGTQINYADNSAIQSTNINLGMSYKNLNFSTMFDKFMSQNTEDVGYVLFQGMFSSIDYSFNITDKLILKPRLSATYQLPFYFIDNEYKEIYNTKNTRLTGEFSLIYKLNKKSQIVTGVEYFNDASVKETEGELFSNKMASISYNNFSTYAEGVFKPKLANFTIGARMDNHSNYGNAFVPRIVVTKVINKLHFKILASRAFKAPTISNIDLNYYVAASDPIQKIKPELTTVYEFETGFQISKKMFLGANIFDIAIVNPIFWAPPPVDTYINLPETGSQGAEVSYRFIDSFGAINLSYAYYRQAHNKVQFYNVGSNDKSYGAFPQNRWTLNANLKFFRNLYITPTVHVFGKRYTYIHSVPDWSDSELVTYEPDVLANLFISYNIGGFEASIGVYDILGTRFNYINSYQGWQNPIPDTGRELIFKLLYRFSL